MDLLMCGEGGAACLRSFLLSFHFFISFTARPLPLGLSLFFLRFYLFEREHAPRPGGAEEKGEAGCLLSRKPIDLAVA